MTPEAPRLTDPSASRPAQLSREAATALADIYAYLLARRQRMTTTPERSPACSTSALPAAWPPAPQSS